MRETVVPIVVGALGTVPKDLEKRLMESEENSTHPDHNIFKIGENTKMNPVKDHQLTLEWKIQK